MTGVGRQCMKQTRSLGPRAYSKITGQLKLKYDAVIIGGGHNGLVAAAYLQKSGLSAVVLERRHVIGGAAVTEEIIPGFKFSRASYLLSLLRPQIYKDLELKRHGLKIYFRDPHSFTPLLENVKGRPPRSLTLGADMVKNQQQIAQFSKKDAEAYPKYEHFMNRLVSAIDPLLDAPPVDTAAITQGSLLQRVKSLGSLRPLIKAGITLGSQFPKYYEVLTAPISKILDQWFESEPLKCTLATDAVIGAMASPSTPGSGYVLLHHVMGELEGRKGSWGYVEGGMGMVSNAIAKAATEAGAEIYTEKVVEKILVDNNGKAYGVVLQDGTEVHSRLVLSNASPHHTFLSLTPQEQLPEEFLTSVSQLDAKSPVTKINVAVDRLPNFLSIPNTSDGRPLPHHQCSIHLNSEHMNLLDEAHEDACRGKPSTSVRLDREIRSGVQVDCDWQRCPDTARPGEDIRPPWREYFPWKYVSGSVIFCTPGAWVLRLQISYRRAVPVRQWSSSRGRSHGSART
ncbi:pyridine nucleotide-disulfide oxidoreductase domain-containing protein 2 isoform X2 [Rana temporaria]|uniref:pyridine nucleotide-disulfide oxidoreductase domain-containing protein 2 isoform X2 n=1 Tax=Rana temporaria TaxID=8407 RepID=UPI001AADE3CC|nr:pyridine nucleotide-disulfide oxidoreductase domain-containing protein 2 isoform X2 [Rana temporaria]